MSYAKTHHKTEINKPYVDNIDAYNKQIQIHCIYPHPQLDAVQLNAPDYHPDIDREPNAIQPSNADSVKEETATSTTEPEDHITIHSTTNRSEHQPSAAHSDSQTIT